MFTSPARCPSSHIRSCVLTLTVIASFLIPIVLVGESDRTRAKAKRAIDAPPDNAPPQSFSIGESAVPSKAEEVIASARRHIGDVLSPPELPEEFRSAKVPSLSERLSAKLNLIAEAVTGEPAKEESKTEEAPLASPQPASTVDFDFDGDTKADVTRWDPGTKQFQVRNSNGGSISTYTFSSASSGAKPAPADYDAGGQPTVLHPTRILALSKHGLATIRTSKRRVSFTLE